MNEFFKLYGAATLMKGRFQIEVLERRESSEEGVDHPAELEL